MKSTIAWLVSLSLIIAKPYLHSVHEVFLASLQPGERGRAGWPAAVSGVARAWTRASDSQFPGSSVSPHYNLRLDTRIKAPTPGLSTVQPVTGAHQGSGCLGGRDTAPARAGSVRPLCPLCRILFPCPRPVSLPASVLPSQIQSPRWWDGLSSRGVSLLSAVLAPNARTSVGGVRWGRHRTF